MRKRERKALGNYCRDLADALELRDWTINLAIEEPASPDRRDGKRWGASSEAIPGRKVVELTFAPDVCEWDARVLRVTVAHELIHAHFAPLVEMYRTDLDGHLGEQAYQLFNSGATRWLEFGVEAMADATAKHLPLIQWS